MIEKEKAKLDELQALVSKYNVKSIPVKNVMRANLEKIETKLFKNQAKRN